MTYEIVKYSPEFKSQIVELQTHLWSPDVDMNSSYLEWKYERNPYVDTPLIYVALCTGKVVGMRGMYGAKWQVGNPPQILHALCACDLVIAPDHRNQGVFTKIMKAALNDLAIQGYQYVFNLSAGPLTFIGSLAMGWRSIGSLHMKIRRSRQKKNIKAKRFNPFNHLDRNMEEKALDINPRLSVELTPRPQAMSELVERIGSDGRIRHVRDQQYFAWRFKNPISQYRFLYWEDSSLDGYLVLQTSVYRDRLKISIVDWEATNMQVRTDLLQTAIHLGNFNVLSIWSATLLDEIKILLQNTGFNPQKEVKSITKFRPTILVRPVRDEMLKTNWVIANRRILDLESWDLRMIYSDGY